MDADPEELTGLDVCPDHGLQGSSGTTVPDPGMQLPCNIYRTFPVV